MDTLTSALESSVGREPKTLILSYLLVSDFIESGITPYRDDLERLIRLYKIPRNPDYFNDLNLHNVIMVKIILTGHLTCGKLDLIAMPTYFRWIALRYGTHIDFNSYLYQEYTTHGPALLYRLAVIRELDFEGLTAIGNLLFYVGVSENDSELIDMLFKHPNLNYNWIIPHVISKHHEPLIMRCLNMAILRLQYYHVPTLTMLETRHCISPAVVEAIQITDNPVWWELMTKLDYVETLFSALLGSSRLRSRLDGLIKMRLTPVKSRNSISTTMATVKSLFNIMKYATSVRKRVSTDQPELLAQYKQFEVEVIALYNRFTPTK